MGLMGEESRRRGCRELLQEQRAPGSAPSAGFTCRWSSPRARGECVSAQRSPQTRHSLSPPYLSHHISPVRDGGEGEGEREREAEASVRWKRDGGVEETDEERVMWGKRRRKEDGWSWEGRFQWNTLGTCSGLVLIEPSHKADELSGSTGDLRL